jgi:hypothetical protein
VHCAVVQDLEGTNDQFAQAGVMENVGLGDNIPSSTQIMGKRTSSSLIADKETKERQFHSPTSKNCKQSVLAK